MTVISFNTLEISIHCLLASIITVGSSILSLSFAGNVLFFFLVRLFLRFFLCFFFFCRLTIIRLYVDLFLIILLGSYYFINQRICVSHQFWKILRHCPFLSLLPSLSPSPFFFLFSEPRTGFLLNEYMLDFLILSSVFQPPPPYFSISYLSTVHLG